MNTPEESTNQNGSDTLVEYLKEALIPVTLENWLNVAFPGKENPTLDDLEAEEIDQIPEFLLNQK